MREAFPAWNILLGPNINGFRVLQDGAASEIQEC